MKLNKPMKMENAKPFNSPDFLYEIKYDGYRVLVKLNKAKTSIISMGGHDLVEKFGHLSDIHLSVKNDCIIDGELICIKDGKVSFEALQQYSRMNNFINSKEIFIGIIGFDILQINSKSITNLPLIKRKKILKDTVIDNEYLSVIDYIIEDGKNLFKIAKINKLEGIVAKRIDSIYRYNIRSYDWLKIKCLNEVDLYVAGYEVKENDSIYLLMADLELKYYGQVILPKQFHNEFHDRIKNKYTKKIYYPKFNNIKYIKLFLIVSVTYLSKTEQNLLRHVKFKRFI